MKLSYKEWIPIIGESIERKVYGASKTCELCMAVGGMSKPDCPDCICSEYVAAMGLPVNMGTPCCSLIPQGEVFDKCDRSYGTQAKYFRDNLRLMLDWTKAHADAEDTPCDGCEWILTKRQALAKFPKCNRDLLYSWHCDHPKVGFRFDDSGLPYGGHSGPRQRFIFESCPGKVVELWGLKTLSPENEGRIWGKGNDKSSTGLGEHDSPDKVFDRWFLSKNEAVNAILGGDNSLVEIPVRVTAEGKEIITMPETGGYPEYGATKKQEEPMKTLTLKQIYESGVSEAPGCWYEKIKKLVGPRPVKVWEPPRGLIILNNKDITWEGAMPTGKERDATAALIKKLYEYCMIWKNSGRHFDTSNHPREMRSDIEKMIAEAAKKAGL